MPPERGADRTRRFAGRSPRERSGRLHGIGDIVDGLMQERALARGVPLGRLAARWEEVVGPKLAEVTAPVRLENGVLHLRAATSAWAAQVRFLAPDIATRANELLAGAARPSDRRAEAAPGAGLETAPQDRRDRPATAPGTGVREVTVSVGSER